jgi:hypothetical protein
VKKYVVKLTEDERKYLYRLISAGSASARMLNRARILLKTDVGKHSEGGPLIDREPPCSRDLHDHGAAFLQAGARCGARTLARPDLV